MVEQPAAMAGQSVRMAASVADPRDSRRFWPNSAPVDPAPEPALVTPPVDSVPSEPADDLLSGSAADAVGLPDDLLDPIVSTVPEDSASEAARPTDVRLVDLGERSDPDADYPGFADVVPDFRVAPGIEAVTSADPAPDFRAVPDYRAIPDFDGLADEPVLATAIPDEDDHEWRTGTRTSSADPGRERDASVRREDAGLEDPELSGDFEAVQDTDASGSFPAAVDPFAGGGFDVDPYDPAPLPPPHGDRVDGWVRPQYRDEPVSGDYWKPVPDTAYGWPVPVERIPPVPPTAAADLIPDVESEPTALVQQWPPALPADREASSARSADRQEFPARFADDFPARFAGDEVYPAQFADDEVYPARFADHEEYPVQPDGYRGFPTAVEQPSRFDEPQRSPDWPPTRREELALSWHRDQREPRQRDDVDVESTRADRDGGFRGVDRGVESSRADRDGGFRGVDLDVQAKRADLGRQSRRAEPAEQSRQAGQDRQPAQSNVAGRPASAEGPIWTVPDLPDAALPELTWARTTADEEEPGRRRRASVRMRRQRAAADNPTQNLPPVEASNIDRAAPPQQPPRARPRPRPRPGAGQTEVRSTVYVSKHAASD
ncbi:hypothetical protein [Actinoplanes sp. NPDC051859]|uniref:hypothetical protein n=1 Tax=Actinoplanes sp. NPDC051859 TaxID=3363909 RepID=UPI003791DF31